MTHLKSSALAVVKSWFWYLSAPSMESEWAWRWPLAGGGAAERAALLACRRVGVVPRGGDVLTGVILGGVDLGVRLLGVEDLGELLPLILKLYLSQLIFSKPSSRACLYDGKCQKNVKYI